MKTHALAGQAASKDLLVNVPRLVSTYYTRQPDINNPAQRVAFGTSGHRGTSSESSFNEAHVLAICQAICEYRKQKNISGPLFIGMDTHALSEAAFATAVEVFAANEVEIRIDANFGYTPTPVISHAILTYNRKNSPQLANSAADGVVITPSHNPPTDGGFKYNPPSGGPADTEITRQIQDRANQILENGLREVKRLSYEKGLQAETTRQYDYITPYVMDLKNVVRLDLIAKAGIKIGIDPMGGAAVEFWGRIIDAYHLNMEVVNPTIDPTFSFMTLDYDGKIRMDCSSAYAMARLINLKDKFDLAFGNDPDVDRHGIVTPSGGLMDPNHYLAVAIWYLFQNRPGWGDKLGIGKTLVSSSMIDRVAADLHKKLIEVPVGFKWFVSGLREGWLGFGGEESAGASFARLDGTVWTTDKDGIILNLLAAEILATLGRDPAECYLELESRFGATVYARIDAPATPIQKALLKKLSSDQFNGRSLAGDPIQQALSHAPGNGAPIDGIKVITANGWFAARPSGTENLYKVYAESFQGKAHLRKIQEEAQSLLRTIFQAQDVR